MDKQIITLQEVYLPVVFAHGYLYAFQTVMGRANVDSYYQAAANVYFSSSNDMANKSWLEPLYCYFGTDIGIPKPLDYFFLRLIQAGLIQNMPPKEDLIKNITKKVGKTWWYGDAPISTYQNRQSLEHVFAPLIRAELDMYKFGAPNIDHLSVKSSTELAFIGMQTFAKELSYQSRIDCQVQIRDNNSELEFIISECPFCLNQSTLCHVFVGVIEGLLEWMHGAHQPNAISTRMMIDEQITTSHIIILDLK